MKKKILFFCSQGEASYEGLNIDRWYGHKRCPLLTGDVRMTAIWKANYANTTRRDLWLLDEEDETTLLSPVGDYDTNVQISSAKGILDLTANLADGDTVTIGTKVYTFQDTLTDVDGNVKIGATQNNTVDNFASAIDLSGVAGTDYATSMTVNTDVTGARASGDLNVTAIVRGPSENSIVTTETSAVASWGGATLSGGEDDFNDWLIGESIGSGHAYQTQLYCQITGSKMQGINGIRWGSVWVSNAIQTDGNVAPTWDNVVTGTQRMDAIDKIPDSTRTGDYSISVIGSNSTSGGSGIIYGHGYNANGGGGRLHCDRSTNKRLFEYRNHAGTTIVYIDLASQVDDNEIRSMGYSVIDDVAYVYLNGVFVDSVDVTGLRNSLNWQWGGFTFMSGRASEKRMSGDFTVMRLALRGWTADEWTQLHEADQETFNLP